MRFKLYSATIICGILAASLGMRLGAQTSGETMMSAVDSLFLDEANSNATASALSDLILELSEKEERLEQKNAEILEREAALRDREDELRVGLETLLQAQSELRAVMGEAQTASQEDIERLADYYQSMKPKPASDVFEIMDEKMAAGIFSLMSTEAVSAILSNMTPEKSYSISVVMAARGIGLADGNAGESGLSE